MALPLPAVAAGAVGGYEAEKAGLLDTSTPAGWATIWALSAFVILTFVLARGERLMAGFVRALEFVVIVMLAHAAGNYLLHTNLLTREGQPWADGLRLTQ